METLLQFVPTEWIFFKRCSSQKTEETAAVCIDHPVNKWKT